MYKYIDYFHWSKLSKKSEISVLPIFLSTCLSIHIVFSCPVPLLTNSFSGLATCYIQQRFETLLFLRRAPLSWLSTLYCRCRSSPLLWQIKMKVGVCCRRDPRLTQLFVRPDLYLQIEFMRFPLWPACIIFSAFTILLYLVRLYRHYILQFHD